MVTHLEVVESKIFMLFFKRNKILIERDPFFAEDADC